MQSTPPWGSHQVDQSDGPPAWRTSLKTTGVKPWDVDLDYVPGQQQAPRSVGFDPISASKPAPFVPAPPQQGGEQKDGPQVVHLQYNSPMGLYSKENVQETFVGQTKAMAAGGPSP